MQKPKRKSPAKAKSPAGLKNTKSLTAPMVNCWEDDPGSPQILTPIAVPAPNQAAKPFAFKLGGTPPPPALYEKGTTDFRYYATVAALRRTADF